MIGLIKKDLKLNFAIKASVISLVLFLPFMILVVGLEEGQNLDTLMILSYGYILTNMPFKYDAREKPHVLIQSLPIKKRDVVISKYVALIINYLIGLTYTWIIFNLLDLVGFNIDGSLGLSTIKETFFIFILMSSISLPAYLRLPPKLGNIVNVMIYIIMMNLFVFTPGGNEILNIINKYSNNGLMTLILLGLIYFLSMGISIILYETKDLY